VSITRRSVLQGALVVAATLSAGTSGALAPPPALLVYDSRLAQSRTFGSRHAGRAVDLAGEHVNLWRNLRSVRTTGTVVGLTRWSDYVQARALLEEQRLRLRTEARWGSLFFWEMARGENAGAQALSRGV
jgi:hypothetical protein